jgi:hypothetical protein
MTAARDARVARQTVPDAATAEHILLGSENLNPDPKIAARTLRQRVHLRNSLLRTNTELALYEEGVLKVVTQDRSRRDAFHLDLHYLDPVPTITRVVAKRTFGVALGCTALAGLAAALRLVDVLRPSMPFFFLVAAVAAVGALAVALRRSHERIEFFTLHGRASVLCLLASLGSLRRFRAFVPVLSRAIEEAAERIVDDPSAYLRAEMREHYRLRGTGVLSNEACAAATGLILSQFDASL